MSLRRRRPGLVYPVNEDWHYVGDTGEPAFETWWANATSDRNLAFRIREAGTVDVHGYIENTNAPAQPSAALFTLPADYWPSADTFQGSCVVYVAGGTTNGYTSVPVDVDSAGTVALAAVGMTDQFGSGAYILYAWVHGQFFLTPASAP